MTYLRKLLAIALAVFATILLLPSIVFADDVQPINPTDTLASVRLSAVMVMFITGAIMPLVVGFVTNVRDHPLVKGILQLILNAVAALIVQTTLVDGSVAFSKQTVLVWAAGTAASVVAYYTAWRPAQLTSSLVPTRGVGLGDGVVLAADIPAYVPGKLSTTGLRQAA